MHRICGRHITWCECAGNSATMSVCCTAPFLLLDLVWIARHVPPRPLYLPTRPTRPSQASESRLNTGKDLPAHATFNMSDFAPPPPQNIAPQNIAPAAQDDGSGVVPQVPEDAPEPAPITEQEVGEYREQDRFLPVRPPSRPCVLRTREAHSPRLNHHLTSPTVLVRTLRRLVDS